MDVYYSIIDYLLFKQPELRTMYLKPNILN